MMREYNFIKIYGYPIAALPGSAHRYITKIEGMERINYSKKSNMEKEIISKILGLSAIICISFEIIVYIQH